jgi:hypothetical protein
MKVSVILLILLFLVLTITGCVEKPEIPQTTLQTTITTTPTPNEIPSPAVSILPPALEIELFKNRYNDRDLDGLLRIFSDRVKAEHPVEDFEKELGFADNHSIKIVDWDVSNVTVHHGNPPVQRRGAIDVRLSLVWKNGNANVNFTLPMVCDDDCLIDGWIFNFIRETVKYEDCLNSNLSSNVSKECWEIIAKKALQIAMNDSKVKMAIGTDYRILNVAISSLLRGSVGYYVTYPVVVVDKKESTEYIFVDVKNETVVHIGTVYKLPVPPPEEPE